MNRKNYIVKYFDCVGLFKGEIANFISLEYGRKRNAVGAASLTLPGKLFDITQFAFDDIIEIYRFNETTKSFVLVGQTCWFLKKINFDIDSDGSETIELTFYDSISILQKRVVAWYANDVTKSNVIEYPSGFLAPLDDQMKYIVRHNFIDWTTDMYQNTFAGIPGGLTNVPSYVSLVNRQTILQCETFDSEGPMLQGSYAWKNVLTALQDLDKLALANNVNLIFDIVYSPGNDNLFGSLVFTTWVGIRGNDLTNTFVFSLNNKTLTKASLDIDFTTYANTVYANGIESPDDADGFNETLGSSAQGVIPGCLFAVNEIVADYSSNESIKADINGLFLQAQQGLALNRSKITITGTINQQNQWRFFTNYNYGDKVFVELKDYKISSFIDQFAVSVDSDGTEDISIPFKAEAFI